MPIMLVSIFFCFFALEKVPHNLIFLIMNNVFNIYDTSSCSGVYVCSVFDEFSARNICLEHNRFGKSDYMYYVCVYY